MCLLIHLLMWITLFTTPAICLGSLDKEKKKFTTSSDLLEHEPENMINSSDYWSAVYSDEQIVEKNFDEPIKNLPADLPKQSAATDLEKRERTQKSNGGASAMQSIKRRIKERGLDETSSDSKKKETKKRPGKVPPRFVIKGKYNQMKPSIHTIVACITAMMVVFHIIICISVWQQCKTHNNRIMGATLPVEAITPRQRPRQNGEQSFSNLVEEPALIGEVPLPPAYKEGESSKPPSYANIVAPNSDHTRAV